MAFQRARLSLSTDPVIEVARHGAIRLALVGGFLLTAVSAVQLVGGDSNGAITLAVAAPITVLAAVIKRQERPNAVALLAIISAAAFAAEVYAIARGHTEYVAGVGSEITVFGLGILAVFVARERPRLVAAAFLAGAAATVIASQTHLNGLSFEIATDVVVVGAVVGTLMYLVVRVMDNLSEAQTRYSDLASVIPVATLELDLTSAISRIDALAAQAASGDQPHDFNTALAEILPRVRLSFFNDMVNEMVSRYGTWYEFVRGRNAAGLQEHALGVLAQVTQGATSGGGEFTAVDIDGVEQSFVYRWAIGRRPGPNSPVRLVVAAPDVTLLRDAEAALEQQLRDRDQFVASVSHELRTPLTSIMGLTEELVSRPDEFDPAERAELLGIVAAETRDVVDIVEDLLVTARAEAGQLQMNMVPVDLSAETAHIVELLGGDPEADEDVWIEADPGRLRQVMRNLISNAHRHGGPSVRVRVHKSSEGAVFAVRDDGDALPESERERIFEPYERAGDTGAIDSVGLGLHVARLLARQMGGDLTYDHDGVDTIFRLELPLVEATPA